MCRNKASITILYPKASKDMRPGKVPLCAALEAEIAELDDAEKHEFLADLKLVEPGHRSRNKPMNLNTYFRRGCKKSAPGRFRSGQPRPKRPG